MKCQSPISRKNKKNITGLLPAELDQIVLMVSVLIKN